MLYTDTNFIFLHFFVKDLTKEINARPHFREAFKLSEISQGHLFNLGRGNAGLFAGNVGYFNHKTKSDPIFKFVRERLKMYSFTVCNTSEPISGVNYSINVKHKAVAKSVTRFQINRFKHKNYVRMFNGVTVVNRRIGVKPHQVRLNIAI